MSQFPLRWGKLLSESSNHYYLSNTCVIVSTILRLILLLPMQVLVHDVYIASIAIKIVIPLISTDNRQKSEKE